MKARAVIAGVIVIGGLLVVGAGLALLKWRQISQSMAMGGPPEIAQAVVVAPVVRTEWRPTARLSGTVFAIQSVTLSNEVAGTIREVLFESGAVVEAGQTLVQLDTSTQQADLEAAQASQRVAEANVLAARSNLRLREANHRRVMSAGAAGAATDLEIDQAQANLDQAEAQVAQTEAEAEQAAARVRQLETTIAKMSLRAPFKARAGLRSVHPGQFLAEGTGTVALQSIDDTIHLDFAVPQDQAWRVHRGSVVMASVPALGPEPQPITVVAIDATADRGTRNVRVRGEIANPGERLRPGMWIDVEVPTDAPSEQLAVPATAIRRAPYGDHVFVVAPDEDNPEILRAHERLVTLGPSAGGLMIVASGLREGDLVATDGSFKLRDGARVQPGPPSGTANGRIAKAGPPAAGAGHAPASGAEREDAPGSAP